MRWVVDDELSHYEHNHNPDPRIVEDPTWRPPIRMKLARDALGMGPLVPKRLKRGGRRREADESSSEASETETSDQEEDEAEVRRPLHPRQRFTDLVCVSQLSPAPKKRVKSVASTPTPTGSSNAMARPPVATPTSLFEPFSGRRFSFSQLTPPTPTPFLSPSDYPAGPSRPFNPLPPPLPVFALPNPCQIAARSVTHSQDTNFTSPVDLVASFLAATQPSRIHLASALVDAGFGSVEALAVLGCSLSPQTREAVFVEVERRLMLGIKM